MKFVIIVIICLSYAYLIMTIQTSKLSVTRDFSDDSKNPWLWLLVRQVERLETKQIELQKLLNTKTTLDNGLTEKFGRLESKMDKLQGLEAEQNELQKLLNNKNTVIEGLIEKVSLLESKLDNLQGKNSSHNLVMETAVTKLRNDVDAIETRLNQSTLCNNPNGSCRSGWKKFDKHCYYFELTFKTWENAKNSCESKDAYLVKIDNKAENKWLASNMPESAMWIGANDINSEGTFTWASDNSALRFAQWGPGEPTDSGGNEDCAYIVRGEVGTWNDNPCSFKFAYICEE